MLVCDECNREYPEADLAHHSGDYGICVDCAEDMRAYIVRTKQVPANEAEERTHGIILTHHMMSALEPIIDGQPTRIVVNSLAAAMTGALVVGVTEKVNRIAKLRAFAAKLNEYADGVEAGDDTLPEADRDGRLH